MIQIQGDGPQRALTQIWRQRFFAAVEGKYSDIVTSRDDTLSHLDYSLDGLECRQFSIDVSEVYTPSDSESVEVSESPERPQESRIDRLVVWRPTPEAIQLYEENHELEASNVLPRAFVALQTIDNHTVANSILVRVFLFKTDVADPTDPLGPAAFENTRPFYGTILSGMKYGKPERYLADPQGRKSPHGRAA